VSEHRLYDPANPPAWLDPEWWRDTPNCNHWDHPAGVHRARIEAVANLACDLFDEGKVSSAVDMGAGDGAVLELIEKRRPGTQAWGYEIIRDSVRYANDVRGVKVSSANVLENRVFTNTHPDPLGAPGLNWGDLVICTEMLEHLADPHGWARTMAENADWLIASSPWQETPERHEHNHAWCWDREGYETMLRDAGWDIQLTYLIEWSQVVVARSRASRHD
jgi:hypothetical protein